MCSLTASGLLTIALISLVVSGQRKGQQNLQFLMRIWPSVDFPSLIKPSVLLATFLLLKNDPWLAN